MPRFKSNKEYALKLCHPEFGDFYFNYQDKKIYKFTKDLSKVLKWKTSNYIENIISNIENHLNNNSGEILLMFGAEVDDVLKRKLVFERKKYYHHIKFITNHSSLKIAKDEYEKINDIMISNIKEFAKIFKNKIYDKQKFVQARSKFNQNVSIHDKAYNCVQNHNNSVQVIFSVVDASYGFRLLKLRTLRSIQE